MSILIRKSSLGGNGTSPAHHFFHSVLYIYLCVPRVARVTPRIRGRILVSLSRIKKTFRRLNRRVQGGGWGAEEREYAR